MEDILHATFDINPIHYNNYSKIFARTRIVFPTFGQFFFSFSILVKLERNTSQCQYFVYSEKMCSSSK